MSAEVFASLIGQDEVVATLGRAAAGDGMTHAWLFTGPPGSGRSVAARAFAAALLCAEGGCGRCPSCSQVRAGTHQNLVVVTPAGLSISVDEARDVVHRAALAATGDSWRVVLIEDADRLTERAANVWLKAIEEPTGRGVFLLCTPSPEDLPPTIRSRCRHVALRLPRADDVAAVLEAEGIPEAMAGWAARAAQGHVGRARALARDEDVRRQRTEALRLPMRLSTGGECLAAAADLVDSAKEAAERDSKARAQIEADEQAELTGGRRGAKGAAADAAKRARSRETRARRDLLDRALVDVVAFYRDVLAVQLGSDVELVHPDQAPAVERVAVAGPPEATVRRVDAVLTCREAIAANVDPLLAVEALALTLRAG